METLQELIARVERAYDDASRRALLEWVFEVRAALQTTASRINAVFGLVGKHALAADHLPTFLHGQPAGGCVIVGINPGFGDGNAFEDHWKRSSVENYVRLHLDFFAAFLEARNDETSRWWTRTVDCLRFLPEHDDWYLARRPRLHKSVRRHALWNEYREAGGLAACDLVPWHSTSDGLSHHLSAGLSGAAGRDPEVRAWRLALAELARAVIRGAARSRPRALVFLSQPSFPLAKALCADFVETSLTNHDGRSLAVGRGTCDGVDVIALRQQVLVQGPWADYAQDHFDSLPAGHPDDWGWISSVRRWLASTGGLARRLSEDDVRVAAYHLWERRGRAHGRDVEDWLEARAALLERATDG